MLEGPNAECAGRRISRACPCLVLSPCILLVRGATEAGNFFREVSARRVFDEQTRTFAVCCWQECCSDDAPSVMVDVVALCIYARPLKNTTHLFNSTSSGLIRVGAAAALREQRASLTLKLRLKFCAQQEERNSETLVLMFFTATS